MTQVLINLVGNAIKFTDAGEVVIAAVTDMPLKLAGLRKMLWVRSTRILAQHDADIPFGQRIAVECDHAQKGRHWPGSRYIETHH